MSSFENKLCTCEDTVGWKVGQEEGKNLLIVPPVLPVVPHHMAGWTHFWWRPLDLWEVGVFTQSTCRDKEVGFLYWANEFGSLWSWEKIKNTATQGGKRMNCDHERIDGWLKCKNWCVMSCFYKSAFCLKSCSAKYNYTDCVMTWIFPFAMLYTLYLCCTTLRKMWHFLLHYTYLTDSVNFFTLKNEKHD